jgi:phosphomannomutase/phosphoglucomutase
MKASLPRISFDLPPQRKLGVLLALPFLLLAAWCGWCAWQQYNAQSLEDQATAARTSIAKSASDLIAKEQKSLAAHIKSAPVAAAIATQDTTAVATELSKGWKGAKDVVAFGMDLSDQYEASSPGKFAQLALLESVSLKEVPASALVRSGKSFELALAYPLQAQNQTFGIAYGRVPMKSLLDGFNAAKIDESSYLAIRQGSFNAMEEGDKSLADTADSHFTPITGSNLRVVSATVEAAPGPFGLGVMGCAIAALISVLLAGAAATAPSWAGKLKLRKRAPKEVEEEVPLSTILTQGGASPLVRPAHTPASAPVGQSIEVDSDFTLSPSAKALLGSSPFGSEGVVSDDGAYIVLGLVLGGWFVQRGLQHIALGGEAQGASVKVKEGLVEGLVQAGLKVSALDQASHPAVLVVANQLSADAVITLEELRTVPARTRLRLFVQGQPATEADIQSLHDALAQGQVPKANAGIVEHHEVEVEYKRALGEQISLARPVRIKVQGEHEELTARVLDALGAHLATDGQDFELVVVISDQGTALRLANASGVKIAPERVLGLLATDVLGRNPGATVVCDEASSAALSGEVLSLGGVVRVASEGVEGLQSKILETAASLGGDSQGHIAFLDHANALPDGIYAAARFLEIVANAYHADDIFEG